MTSRGPLKGLSRRQFGLLGASGLLLPRRLLAAPSTNSQRFLFIHCSGGWDPSFVFTPLQDSPDVDTEADAVEAEVGGIPFVDSAARPSVRAFLESYADRCCLVNGMEVRSITHERCRQISLTGTGSNGDDWPTLLAAHVETPLALPHLVIAGHAYSELFGDRVVRMGDENQLLELLDGSALEGLAPPVSPPTVTVDALEDAWMQERMAVLEAAAPIGDHRELVERYQAVLDQHELLQAMIGDLDLSVTDQGCERDIAADCALAFDCFEMDLSRCAMLRSEGWCSEGWDTHQDIDAQSLNFEELFAYLLQAMEDLDTRTAPSGEPLAESLTIVLFSEMGRTPQLNTQGGKDHWTFTSAVLIGAGILGGQVVGGVDEQSRGLSIDLATGDTTDSGVPLLADHLGATLLHLGGLDPEEFLSGIDPIAAALKGGR